MQIKTDGGDDGRAFTMFIEVERDLEKREVESVVMTT